MNRFIATIILLFIQSCGFCQIKDNYPSRQEKAYNERQRHYEDFRPESVSFIKGITYDHIKLRSADTHNRFVSSWEQTTYLKYFDSLEQICRTNLWKVIGTAEERHVDWNPVKYMRYYDSLEKLVAPKLNPDRFEWAYKKCDICVDSVKRLIYHYEIAGIKSDQIIRFDSLGAKRLLVYKEFQMTPFDAAFRIAISLDRGQTWNRYFTGLIENNFYYIKPNPTIGLLENDSTIQFEIAIVRQMEPWGSLALASSEMYQVVEDNLIMELNLNKLVTDSDHDGLTDLYEKWLFTNPNSKDSDHDGVEDAIDSNPRFKSVKTKYSNLFLFLLESGYRDNFFIPFERFELENTPGKDASTYFIVTDDANLMNLGETRHRYVILEAKELSGYKKQNQGNLRKISISPLFEIDGMPGAKKVHISFGFAGYSYLIIEKKDGWLVKMISSWAT